LLGSRGTSFGGKILELPCHKGLKPQTAALRSPAARFIYAQK
jgi:hypothetical protein